MSSESDLMNKKNKLVVYTALFGDYDELIDPMECFEGCDFVCFTDQKHISSDIWDVRYIEECDLPPNMMNRRYKLLPHLYLSEYDQSLYIDSNLEVLKSPKFLANKYLKDTIFSLPRHFKRDCIFEEGIECVVLKKASIKDVKKQLSRYKSLGMPKNFGLSENNILFRKHNDEKVIALMKDWWNELYLETRRDQLSLPFVLWRKGVQYDFMDESSREGNGFFLYYNHAKYIKYSLVNRITDKVSFTYRRFFMRMFF